MQISNCDRCYRRKGKCDKLQPCGSCERAGVGCVYTDRTKERRFTADHVERLEKRIRQAEARNKSLADELSRIRVGTPGDSKISKSLAAVNTNNVSKARATNADAVDELSYLAINAAGERRPHLGSASGIIFASLVATNEQSTTSSAPATRVKKKHTDQDIHQSKTSTLRVQRKYEDLPTQQLAHGLVTAFFEHVHIAYPFLDPHTISDAVTRMYTHEGYYETIASCHEAFVANMVFAIASVHLSTLDWQSIPSADSHRVRAFVELDSVMSHNSIETLQCLLLISLWRTTSGVRDDSASMWHTVGIAVRMAVELGLHRESTYSLKPDNESDIAQLQVVQQSELARNCFWCVVALDRITSTILGRPVGLSDSDIDTELPSGHADRLSNERQASIPTDASRMEIFSRIVEYRLFCGKLLPILHRKRPAEVSMDDALRIRDELANELDIWYNSLQELELPDIEMSDDKPQSCYSSPIWFECLYANAKLMIWRPCPLLAEMPNDRHALQRIYDSAGHAINFYASLHRSRLINYSWITLHSVFLAGLSYIYTISCQLRSVQQDTDDASWALSLEPNAMEVMAVTRACSNVLVAVSERWNTQRHCHEVFNRLGDAVLTDLVNLQSTSISHQPQSTVTDSPTVSNESPASAAAALPLHRQAFSQQHISNPNHIAFWQNQQHQQPQLMTSQAPQTHYTGTVSRAPQLTVDTELMHSYDDIRSLYQQQQVETPVMQLTQEWMGYLGNGGVPAGGFVTYAYGQPAQQSTQQPDQRPEQRPARGVRRPSQYSPHTLPSQHQMQM